MQIDFTTENGPRRTIGLTFWYRVLRNLKDKECPDPSQFETWIKDAWGITLVHNSVQYPGSISGVELSEETLTMLLLKYPPN